MSNNKQSSVEWIVEQMAKLIPSGNEIAIYSLQEQAKALHKKEILESYRWGRYDSDKLVMSERFYREQYYEQTYGGNK